MSTPTADDTAAETAPTAGDAPAVEPADTPVVPGEYLYAFVLVAVLFPLWGFANDVTNPLVKAFQDVFQITAGQAAYVQTAFYGGYATMAIPAALAIRKISFKAGILIGLGLYAAGALLFIPASITMQFWVFLVALYVLTFGLAFLETSANPYVLSLGSPETATRRLNFAQAFNPAGSLLGMVVASQFVLPSLSVEEFRAEEAAAHPEYATMLPSEAGGKIDAALAEFAASEPAKFAEIQAHDLEVVRVPYIAIAAVVIALAVTFAVSKLPSTGHTEDPIDLGKTLANLASVRYVGGVIAQGFYVGAQIMCWTFIIHYGMTLVGLTAAEAQRWNIGAMCLFLTGRFAWTYVLKFVNAGVLLGVLALFGILFSAGTIFVQGTAGLVCLVLVSGCMAVMFPTIYGIALDGLSVDDAKLGSAGLIFAIVGGALMPKLQGELIDGDAVVFAGQTLEPVRYSFVLPLVCFVVIAIYGFLTAAIAPRRTEAAS